jgi:hypothetical protein
MSLEWARARALQNEARIRALAKSGGRKEWTEVALMSPAPVTVWVEPARGRHEVPATDLRRQIATQVLLGDACRYPSPS